MHKFANYSISIMCLVLAACGRSEEKSHAVPTARTDAQILGGAITPYTEAAYGKMFETWGEAGVAKINDLRIAAAKHVAKNPQCDVVENTDLSDNRSNPPDSPVIFVDCANGERFYISESDLGHEVVSQSAKARSISRDAAIERCTAELKAQMKFPSSVDRDLWTTSTRQAPVTGNLVIEFDFKAMNGLGMNLPKHAYCTATPEGRYEVAVSDR